LPGNKIARARFFEPSLHGAHHFELFMCRLLAGLLGLAVLILVAADAGVSQTRPDSLSQDLGEIDDFTLTDQNGHTVTRDDLLGKIWVASFIFTRCPGECVAITKNLGDLQRRLGRQDDVTLVSFTVDPDHDTPEVLKAYARQKGADPDRWLFLTGKRQPLYRLITDSFHQGIDRQEKDSQEPTVTHSSRLVVVDHEGRFRGYIDGTKPEEFPRLCRKLQWLVLAKYHYFPTINAALNGLSGILLVLGFLAIKLRRVTAHKTFMLTALAVSTAFLACYLYYHFGILHGHPSGYPGRDWTYPVYLGVLISHSLLAAAVAPLALITAYRGLRGRLAAHVRLARWTLPIWMYVSVTGVLVYWMRYHLFP
jgi:protein SCO1/2/putative membrane protein